MAELPSNWNMTTKPNDKGTLDIHAKDDAGHDYKVRTTDANEITETDIQELRDADREAYTGDRSDAAWTYVHKLIDDSERLKRSREASFGDDLNAASEELIGNTKVRRGFVSRPDTIVIPERIGFSHIPQWRWDLAFKKEN